MLHALVYVTALHRNVMARSLCAIHIFMSGMFVGVCCIVKDAVYQGGYCTAYNITCSYSNDAF